MHVVDRLDCVLFFFVDGLDCAVSAGHGKEQPISDQHRNNSTKRKRLGRDRCLNETASLLRALQSEYARLQLLAKRRRCDPSPDLSKSPESGPGTDGSDASNLASLERKQRRRQPPVFRDVLSRAIVTQHLHSSAFVNCDVIRLLVPFNLDLQSTVVDCSISYAHWLGYCRDSLVSGARVIEVVAPTNFQRILDVLPMFAQCPVLSVRNVPNYLLNTTCDIVASLEHEQSAAGHGPRSGTPRKLLQMMFMALRPLDVSSAVAVGTHSSGATRLQDMVVDDTGGDATSSPSSTCKLAPAVPRELWSTTTEHKSSNAMEITGKQQSISTSHQLPSTATGSHVIVITPQYELGDASSSGAQGSSLVWISSWENDHGGLGSPSPFVPVHADTVGGMSALGDRSEQDQVDPKARASAMHTSHLSEVHSQAPVLLYHSMK